MRWPRLTRRGRRRNAPTEVTAPYTPGSWGQPVAPSQAQPDPSTAPTGNVEVIPAPLAGTDLGVPPPIAPAEVVPAAAPAPVPPSEAEATGVRLGFADGSDLQLDPDDPHTLALKAVAEILVDRGPHRRRRGAPHLPG